MRGRDKLGNQPVGATLQISNADELEENTFMMLFGIHCGQFHDTVVARKAEAATIVEGDELQIPNSVTIVVPTWEITALYGRPKLVQQRKEREMNDANERAKRSKVEPEAISGRAP